MSHPSSADEASAIDPSHIDAVRADYRRSSDAERQDFAAAGPEGDGPPGISYPKPLFGHRLLASAIDSIVVAAGSFQMFAWYAATEDTTFSTRVLALRLLAGLGWGLYYTFTKDGWAGGQSLGKKLVGLMVVNVTTNRPCSWTESATRTSTMVVLPLIPGIGFLIEPIAAVVTADGRRLGDRLAGTQVIEVGDYDPEQ